MEIDAEQVKQDWLENEGQFQLRKIAAHYGIYEHLFGYAYFLPRVKLDIKVNFFRRIINTINLELIRFSIK